MKIPFKFRKITPYTYDGDARFPYNRIKGKSKRYERKKQIRKFLKDDEKE